MLLLAGFFSLRTTIHKSFKLQPTSNLETSSLYDQQREKAEDVEQKRRKFMEEVKQKIRDNQKDF